MLSHPPQNVPCQIYANMQSQPISTYFCRDYMVRIRVFLTCLSIVDCYMQLSELGLSNLVQFCVCTLFLECRRYTSVVGPTTEHSRYNPRVLRLPGSAQWPGRHVSDSYTRLRTSSAGICASLLWASPAVSSTECQPSTGSRWLYHQASHHLPHCCTQWEGIWTGHSSPMAPG